MLRAKNITETQTETLFHVHLGKLERREDGIRYAQNCLARRTHTQDRAIAGEQFRFRVDELEAFLVQVNYGDVVDEGQLENQTRSFEG